MFWRYCMQKFGYSAVDIDQKKYKGYYFAEDEEDLRRLLADQDLFLVKSKAMGDKTPSAFFSVTGKVPMHELTAFCRQFATMINVGIPIVECVDVLRGQSYSSFFRKSLDMVYEDILSGQMLSEAMKKHKRVFPEFFYNMVYVGEMSGSLDRVLNNLADYYEKDNRTRNKMKEAVAYPILLFGMVIAVLALLFFYVIPKFSAAFVGLDVQMPGLTMAIFNASNWLVTYWKETFLGVVAVCLIFFGIGRTKFGRLGYDTIKLKIPVIGKVFVNILAARFARGFGLLLMSGMDTLDALDTMSRILGNKCAEKKLVNAIVDVKNGISLTEALQSQKLFPGILIQMVSVGEKSGSLDEVMLKSCGYFDEEVDSSLNMMMTMLQPILLIILGAIIAVVFLAVYSPILAMIDELI